MGPRLSGLGLGGLLVDWARVESALADWARFESAWADWARYESARAEWDGMSQPGLSGTG